MDAVEPSALPLTDGVVLDARRAVWFPKDGLLAVSDTHLGYAWVDRLRGRLVPVGAHDSAGARLGALIASYRPRRCVLVGDIVHAAVPLPAVQAELRELQRIAELHSTSLELVLGNHDRELPRRLHEWEIPLRCSDSFQIGNLAFVHGDQSWEAPAEAPTPHWLVTGHEHPAIGLSDGLGQRVRCPCFLRATGLLVLPAFTSLAAGCDVGRREFLGPIARRAQFQEAIACVGQRLLRLPLGPDGRIAGPGGPPTTGRLEATLRRQIRPGISG